MVVMEDMVVTVDTVDMEEKLLLNKISPHG